MTSTSVRFLMLGVAAAAVLAVALWPAAPLQAQVQPLVQVAPNFVPIGVASNGSSSTAWFHEPSTGRAMACTSAPTAGGLSPIQCITAKLPRAEP
jgi:hypothetical protein